MSMVHEVCLPVCPAGPPVSRLWWFGSPCICTVAMGGVAPTLATQEALDDERKERDRVGVQRTHVQGWRAQAPEPEPVPPAPKPTPAPQPGQPAQQPAPKPGQQPGQPAQQPAPRPPQAPPAQPPQPPQQARPAPTPPPAQPPKR